MSFTDKKENASKVYAYIFFIFLINLLITNMIYYN